MGQEQKKTSGCPLCMRLGRSSAMYFHFLRARMLPAADCHAWPPEAARRAPPLRLRGPRVPAEISHRHRSGWGWCSSAHRRDIISAPSKFQMHIKLCGSRTKFKNCCERWMHLIANSCAECQQALLLKKGTDMALANLWENLGLPRQTKCNELLRIELNYFMIDSAHRSASTEPQTKLS